jgi:hypothetical protein
MRDAKNKAFARTVTGHEANLTERILKASFFGNLGKLDIVLGLKNRQCQNAK